MNPRLGHGLMHSVLDLSSWLVFILPNTAQSSLPLWLPIPRGPRVNNATLQHCTQFACSLHGCRLRVWQVHECAVTCDSMDPRGEIKAGKPWQWTPAINTANDRNNECHLRITCV